MYIDELKDLVKDIEKILEKNKKWYENRDNLLRKKIKRIGKEKIVPMYSYFPVQTNNPFIEDEHPQRYQQENEEKKDDTFPKIIDKTDEVKEKLVSNETKSFPKHQFKPPIKNEPKQYNPQFKPQEFIPTTKQESKPPVNNEFKPVVKQEFIPPLNNETKQIPHHFKPVTKQEFKPPVTIENKTFPQQFKPTIVNKEFKPNKPTQFIQKKEYNPPVVENKTNNIIERQVNITSNENNLDSKKEELIKEIKEAKDDLKSIEKANNTVERLKNLTNLIL